MENVGFTVEFTALKCTDNNENQAASGWDWKIHH